MTSPTGGGAQWKVASPPSARAVPLARSPVPAPLAAFVIVTGEPGRALEQHLHLLERVGPQRLVPAAHHREAKRPVERRELASPEPPSLTFPQAHTHDR